MLQFSISHLASNQFNAVTNLSLEADLVDLFKKSFPDQPVSVVPASYGRRLIIGKPIPILSSSWHPRFINKNGKDDVTGEVGFCTFYNEAHRIWKGKEDDVFELKNLTVVTALGREGSSPVSGGFYRMIGILPAHAEQFNYNILLEHITNKSLRDLLKSDPNWKFTRCGTYGEDGDASFYLKIMDKT